MSERKIPQIVLDLYDYRAKVYAKSEEPMNLPEFTDIRQRTEYIFDWLYATHGYERFIDTAVRLKKIEGLSGDDFNLAKGLIAELVLECSIKEWQKQTGTMEWNYTRELYIPHRNGKGITEIDVILYSPYTIVVFEVKSYSGRKIVTEACTIRTSRVHDLFAQNGLHIESLMKQIEPLCLSKIGAVKSVYFNFSLGDVVDERTLRNKQLIPIVDETNIFAFLEAMRRNCTKLTWDKKITAKIVELRDSGLSREQHMAQFESGGNES
jgi:hypothetical protein